jgi:pyruvate-ferredoxin/flavodoxin oxidoreductase
MRATIDGNEAAASVAYRLNEVCCIYPITPSSPMAELADEWSSRERPNVWGTVPAVMQMQSEGGAAGALHGALQGGALATTFTASQGLLLMIPNMYKIAGELTPMVMHVAARSLAAQGLSIFGDHSDVMAVRQTGFALLAAASVQEAHDLALVAQAATLATRVPFVHFFDGFRTSHELNTIELLSDDDLRALVPEELIRDHRARALSPERPFIRGTAQNPDVYFQARETVNPFYARTPEVVQDALARLGERTAGACRSSTTPGTRRSSGWWSSWARAPRPRRRPWPPSTSAASASGSSRCGSTGPSPRARSWRRCRPPRGASRCSTARRSPARSASRCSSTSWRR